MKKKRLQWKSLALLLAAVTALGGLYYYGVFARKKESSDVYSVILYQNTEDEWGTLIQGIMQAEEERLNGAKTRSISEARKKLRERAGTI